MRRSYRALHHTIAGLVRFLLRVRVTGLENEPAGGALLLCSNHVCLLDPICICAALRQNEPYYMAKKSLFAVPILRHVIRFFHAFPVDRGASDLGAIHTTLRLLADGNCVGIFPQGTRCRGKDLTETTFKTGAAMIAARANVPILPVRITMKHNRWCPFRRIDVTIGTVIPPSELPCDGTRQQVHQDITELLFARLCALTPAHQKERLS